MSTTRLAVSVGRAGDNVKTRGGEGRQTPFRDIRVSAAATLLGVAVVALGGPQRAAAQDCSWEQKGP